MYDVRFHIFLEVNTLLEKLITDKRQWTEKEANAIHEFAKKLAKDFRSGDYE